MYIITLEIREIFWGIPSLKCHLSQPGTHLYNLFNINFTLNITLQWMVKQYQNKFGKQHVPTVMKLGKLGGGGAGFTLTCALGLIISYPGEESMIKKTHSDSD